MNSEFPIKLVQILFLITIIALPVFSQGMDESMIIREGDKLSTTNLNTRKKELNLLYEIKEDYRKAKKSMGRNIALTILCASSGVATQISGVKVWENAEGVYSEYEAAYNSDDALVLREEILSLDKIANTLFLTSEISFMLSGVFFIWGVFDIGRLASYKKKIEKYEGLSLNIIPTEDGVKASVLIRH